MQQLGKGAALQGGKYVIERVLGQGGFGITYLAKHTLLEKLVAIKEFFPKDFCERNTETSHISLGNANTTELVSKLKEKFIKEAKNISKLNHPNIVAIHDIFEENGTAYYLMDFIDGVSLNDRIKADGALDEADALRYIRSVGSAVAYMHTKSMNHLDIKPANIMLRTADDAPILIDFGLAKQYDSAGEQTSTTPVGISHGYAPVEQYRPGGVSTFTPQTDVYALGATLFALLSGNTPPHYSEILEDGLPELPVSVSAKTADAIEHAMEIKKNKRPESIDVFLSELGEEITQNVPNPADSVKSNTLREITVAPKEQTEKDEVKAAREEVKKAEDVVLDSEATVMIGKSVNVKDNSKEPSKDAVEDDMFVDLGLSVKWASMNIGASKPEEFGFFVDKRDSDSLNKVYEWNLKGAHVPTIAQFDELRHYCYWEQTELHGVSGYLVKGRNGNTIFLPMSGDDSDAWFKTFGRLFTRESLYGSVYGAVGSGSYYFYFNRQGDYKHVKYSIEYKCPVRLVKEK